MKESQIDTTIGRCVIDLTKYLMVEYQSSEEAAYKRLMRMELYAMLLDKESRLYLETNEYLKKCCEVECKQGVDAFYRFVNEN